MRLTMVSRTPMRHIMVALAAMVTLAGLGTFTALAHASQTATTVAASTTFTSADVGFSEGGTPTDLADRLDAMDTYVGSKKPIIRIDLE